MVIYCAYEGCKAKNGDSLKGERIKFHRFPTKRFELTRKWLEAISKSRRHVRTPNCYVCSQHFVKSDYLPGSSIKLKPTAIPIRIDSSDNIKSECDLLEPMYPTCAVLGCPNLKSEDSTIPFHKFPLNKPDLVAKWLTAMRRTNFKPDASTLVCDDHFISIDYDIKPNGRVLRNDAVPRLIDPVQIRNAKKTNAEAESRSETEVGNTQGATKFQEVTIKVEKLDENEIDCSGSESKLKNLLIGKGKETLQILIVGENGEITNSELSVFKGNDSEDVKPDVEALKKNLEKNGTGTGSTNGNSQKIASTNTSNTVNTAKPKTENTPRPYHRSNAYYQDAITKLRQKLITARRQIKSLQRKCRKLSAREDELKTLLKLLVLKRGKGEKNIDQLFEEYKKNMRNADDEAIAEGNEDAGTETDAEAGGNANADGFADAGTITDADADADDDTYAYIDEEMREIMG